MEWNGIEQNRIEWNGMEQTRLDQTRIEQNMLDKYNRMKQNRRRYKGRTVVDLFIKILSINYNPKK